jgi:hypothetical protein
VVCWWKLVRVTVRRTAVRVTKPVSVRVSGDGVRKDEETSKTADR